MRYSSSYRRHVLGIREREGLSYAETAARFSVGVATLVRWNKRIERNAYHRTKGLKIDMAELKKDVGCHPDSYQYERAARFKVTQQSMWHALKRLGVTYKKALMPPKADADKRRSFQKRIDAYKAASRALVYVDESGFAHDMPRTHGYSKRGKRCFGTRNWGAKGRTNVIGALSAGAMLTTWLCNFNIDTEVYSTWVRTELIPVLPPGAVVIKDNATFHKHPKIEKALNDEGHILEFLSPYSPDLNPIEHKWAQAKALRRKTGATVEQIFKTKL